MVLQKDLPLNRSMLYSPMVTLSQVKNLQLSSYKDKIEKIGQDNHSIFYRFEMDIPKDLSTFGSELSTQNFFKSFEHMQPENTWILELQKDEEALLAQMSMRCRYNVRLAQKSGVIVESASFDDKMLDGFYQLYLLTGKRHGITFRSSAYFKNFLEILSKDSYARIYTATVEKDEKKLLSAGIVVYSGRKAIYMFGASSNELRNLKAPNLLVWQMMLDAKKAGFQEFDFFGIAPDDDPKHPWAGITSFKKQFGGHQVDILGSFDLVLRPLEYKMFKTLEKIRR